jgi:hypothetical protein
MIEFEKKSKEMKLIQENIAVAKEKQDIIEQMEAAEREYRMIEQRELEEIKNAIAAELKKQYLALIQNENQILGDVRDKDVID